MTIATINKKKRIWIEVFLCCFVLISMLLFFELAHPFVVLDVDDWTYISASRIALPSTKFWNPARILPEVLMPYPSGLGVLLLSPLGYIPAITIMNGLVLSLFITLYVYEFYALLTRKLKLHYAAAALCACLFLLFHFTVFRTQPNGNDYLFRANNVTCVYYYIIPGVLNCTLMMILIRTGINRTFLEKKDLIQKGFLVMLVYLAVLSNLFESVIIAVYCGTNCLIGFLAVICGGKEQKKQLWRTTIKEQFFNISTVLLWFISVWFEKKGGRGQYPSHLAFGKSLKQTIVNLVSCFQDGHINRIFLLFTITLVFVFLIVVIGNKRTEIKMEGRILLMIISFAMCVLLFELLLCARVNPNYITRNDTLFGVYFALLALPVIIVSILLKRFPYLILFVPLLLLVFYTETNTYTRTFYEGNALTISAELCTRLDNDIIEQITEADQSGKTDVTVHVIDCKSNDNWPFALYMGDRIASSLFKHGVTGKLMNITIEADPSLNLKYHLIW